MWFFFFLLRSDCLLFKISVRECMFTVLPWIVASVYLVCISASTHICIARTLAEMAAETSSGPNDNDKE